MEQRLLDRINALARKAKAEGLTPAETAERDALRKQYLAEFRAGFRAQLENTVVVGPDGARRKLKKKE